MSRRMRNVIVFFFACLFLSVTSPQAAERNDVFYELEQARIKHEKEMEERERRKVECEEIIALHRDNDDPEIQRLVARAMRERAVLGPGGDGRLALLDEMIARYSASEDDDIEVEVIAAKLAKAEVYFWRFDSAYKQTESALYDEVIAKVGDRPEEALQRMAARAMSQKCHLVDRSERAQAIHSFLDKYGASGDPYIKEWVAKSMIQLARLVSTEIEKNGVLNELFAKFQFEESEKMQSLVKEAKDGITDDSGIDILSANSFDYSPDEKANSALRQSWRCENAAEKHDL